MICSWYSIGQEVFLLEYVKPSTATPWWRIMEAKVYAIEANSRGSALALEQWNGVVWTKIEKYVADDVFFLRKRAEREAYKRNEILRIVHGE